MRSLPLSATRPALRRRTAPPKHRLRRIAPRVSSKDAGPSLPGLYVPTQNGLVFPEMRQGGAETTATGFDEHRPMTPPPDLPSLMLDSRIVYLVTELIIAQLFYLQYKDANKPVYLYINSSGTTRADGEVVGFETEGMAIYDTMQYIKNEIFTAGVGIAIGQACMLLSAGSKGKRFMLPHATAMLYQPTVPPTGQRQAIEIQIKWREVLAQKQDFLSILSKTTGHSVGKLDQVQPDSPLQEMMNFVCKDMQRPLYMQPVDAIEYGVIDKIIKSEKQEDIKLIDEIKSPEQWDREAGIRTQPAPPQ